MYLHCSVRQAVIIRYTPVGPGGLVRSSLWSARTEVSADDQRSPDAGSGAHPLRRLEQQPLLEGNAKVDVNHLCRPLVHEDVHGVAVAQSHDEAHLQGVGERDKCEGERGGRDGEC